MRFTPKTPEVRVPRFVGLMAMDARETAAARGVLLAAPDRPDFRRVVVDYVVRQYPPPDTEVPRGAVVTVWFELGPDEGDGGAGVREPRVPAPPSGGLRREIDETGTPPGEFEPLRTGP
ncbi:PASTA domain-containing protein [Streptomyces sp. NPDC058001]|uniref:PASTA domain-containing protein n=1 Tax=Streptomyces sp. NPDC058001 TaxID=3346300 RepID=UPI0036ED3C6F